MSKKKNISKKRICSPKTKEKREARQYKIDINTVFKNASFVQIPTRDIEFNYNGMKGEIDNIYVYDNIVVISEDTCAKESSNICDHLRKKSFLYKEIEHNTAKFIEFMRDTYQGFREYRDRNKQYDAKDYKIRFIYCSMYPFNNDQKSNFENIVFVDYVDLKYFLSLAKSIHKSSRFELLKFLKVNFDEIGIETGTKQIELMGFLLPDSKSGFQDNHNVVTFYIAPKTLIELSYVLRKDGNWRNQDALYQRLIIKSKIKSMREYLSALERVFINNIIVTLPSETKLLDAQGDKIRIESENKTISMPVKIQIPEKFNTIGIIDGQHRVFAYHEGDDAYEENIKVKRIKQNLLVTGIIYPASTKDSDKGEFESKLFLEINDKQSKVRSELRQSIQTIVHPFTAIAISRAIISKMGNKGPLENMLEIHSFDSGKIKTTSIVSYGLVHLVKFNGNDSLYKVWDAKNKEEIIAKQNKELLNNYIEYCTSQINIFISAYKNQLKRNNMFTMDKKVSRALSITALNGALSCFRKIIENNQVNSFDYYTNCFNKLKIEYFPDKFQYKSSNWKSLGDEMYKQCFL